MQRDQKPPFVPRSSFTPQIRQYIPMKNINEADIDKLFATVLDNNYDKIKSFISENNVTYDVINKNGETVLHMILKNTIDTVVEDQKLDLIKFFVEHGVSVGAYDTNNITALHLACKSQLSTVVDYLLNNGADPNALDNEGMTPMHYLVQGNIIECKKRKEIKSIVPKPVTPTPQVSKKAIREGLKDISTVISEILVDDEFAVYIKHIKNSINAMYEIYPIEFSKIKREYNDKISQIITSNSSNNEKKNQIKTITSSTIKSVSELIKTKLNSSLRNLDIKPNQTNGWGPDQDKQNKILPESYDPNIRIQKEENEIKTDAKATFNNINDSLIKFSEKMDVSKINVNKMYENLSKIIYHNLNVEANTKNPDEQHSVQWEKLHYNYTVEKKMFEYPVELNLINNHIVFDYLTPTSSPNPPEVIRGKKQQRDTWLQDKTKKIAALPLTIDPNTNVGPNAAVGQNKILSLNLLDFLDNEGNFVNADIPGDLSIYYISFLLYFVKQVPRHYIALKSNIETIMDHVSNNYLYEIDRNLIPHCVTGILNMLQNFVYLLDKKDYILRTTTEIEKLFGDAFIAKPESPYNFSFEYATFAAKEIKTLVQNFYSDLDGMYENLLNIHNKLNDIISLINRVSAFTFIKTYFNNDQFEVATTFDKLNKLNDRLVTNINKLPNNLSEYSKEYSALTKSNAMLLRKTLFERYVPNVNISNYHKYYSNYNYGADLSKLKPILPSEKVNMKKQYRKGSTYIEILTPANETKSVIGYLPHIENLVYDVKTNTYVGLTNDPVILQQETNDNLEKKGIIGDFGYIFNDNNFAKENPVFVSIGDKLDLHFTLLKYSLIKNIILLFAQKSNIPASNEVLESFASLKEQIQKNGVEKNVDARAYTTIGKTSDFLITVYIDSIITENATFYIQNIIKTVDATTYSTIMTDMVNKQGMLGPDNNFEFNFNKLYDEIVDVFEGDTNLDYNSLSYTTKLMSEEHQNSPQYPIQNQNYTFSQQITQEQCYKIQPNIVKLLVDKRANINQKDAVFFTPLHYALETLHVDLIRELLNNGAIVNKFNTYKSMDTPSPFKSFMNSYRLHNIYDKKTVLHKLYDPLFKNIRDNLEMKPEYKNNVMKYLENIFPQTLIMYNNLFYNYMMAYINRWGYNDVKTLQKYIYRDSFTLLNIVDYTLTDHTTNLDVLSSSIQNKNNEIKQDNVKLDKIYHEISNLQKEYYAEQDEYSDERKNVIQERITELYTELSKIRGDEPRNLQKKENIEKNLTNQSDNVKEKLQQNIEQFLKNKKYLQTRSPSEFYWGVFDFVVNNGTSYNGHEDFNLYNEMWKQNINNTSRLENMTNIHYTTLIIESKLMDRLEQAKSKDDVRKIKEDFDVLNKLFKNVFCPMINDYKNLDQTYKQDNYMMTEIVNIIIHNTALVLCSNLYLAIIKMTTGYLISLNPQQNSMPSEQHNSYVVQVINNIVNKDGSEPKLEMFIIKKMPKKLVKHILKIYTSETDEDMKISSLDMFFDTINNLLMENNTLPIKQDSSLIKNLTTYIYPYYKDVFTSVIESLKVMIDNYNRYIVNQGRYIEIMTILLSKVMDEY